MSQGPRRLSAHRMALALALVSAGPPLVVHNGWPGLVLAIAGAAYAAYLLLGKRWPKLRRRAVRRPSSPGPASPRPGSRTAQAGSAASERAAPPVIFEQPAPSADSGRPEPSGPEPSVHSEPLPRPAAHSEPLAAPRSAPRFRREQSEESDS